MTDSSTPSPLAPATKSSPIFNRLHFSCLVDDRCSRMSTCSIRTMAPLWLALGLSGLAGCSGSSDGPARVAVDGQVTYRGEPVSKGSILFIPIEDTRGPRVGTAIEQGRYRIPRHRGPVVGLLRVEIRAERKLAYDITEPTESVKHIGEPLPSNDIPPEFNEASTLVIATRANGANTFHFHLPGRP
jgi:hypothetical protein